MATAAQIRMIWGSAKEAGMDSDELHALVAGLTGVDSIRHLNVQQAIRVIDRLSALAGRKKDVPDRATLKQQYKILALAREMGWDNDPARLRGFLEKRAGVSDVRFLTLKGANHVIEALKAMQKGGRGATRRKEEAHERLDEGNHL